MVRTHIQLSDKQAKELKAIARRKQVSMAELIRQGVDAVIAASGAIDRDTRKKRAIEAVGKFRSGKNDISDKHDEYLAQAMK